MKLGIVNALNNPIKAGSAKEEMPDLHQRIIQGNIEEVIELINDGADIETRYFDMTPLYFAFIYEKTQIANALIDLGANKNALYQNIPMLHMAISKRKRVMAKTLLDKGADLEILYEGMSPLFYALARGQIAIAHKLHELGANKNVQYGDMPIIHWAISQSKLKMVQTLVNMGADTEILYEGMTSLHFAISRDEKNIIKYLLRHGANSESLYKKMTPLMHALIADEKNASVLINAKVNVSIPIEVLRSVKNKKIIEALFPHCLIYGCKLNNLLINQNQFEWNKIDFLKLRDPIRFLKKNKLCSEQTIAALRILASVKKIEEHEHTSLFDNESAMSNSKVARANWHYANNVLPNYLSKLVGFSETKDKLEGIAHVEKQIRQLILNAILKEAKLNLEQDIVDFITGNEAALIALEDDVLRRSCQVFTSKSDPAQAAWRGYNPHAPLKDVTAWPNLLTPPLTTNSVWTTRADNHNQRLDPNVVYATLRERIAIYYLAVTDKFDGDKILRANRIQNFICQLADIRNAHGMDDPSCYPGTITRIADMGAFSAIAQLPATTKEMLEDFFVNKVLNAFQIKIDQFDSKQEKEALHGALTVLTENNAKSVIHNPTQYPIHWLKIRTEFIASLGSAQEIMEHIFTHDLFPIIESDIIYIRHLLMDISAGKIGAALSAYFHQQIDSIPTIEDIKKANPFEDSEPRAYEICEMLLQNILEVVPVYTTSLQQLTNFSGYLKQKIPAILQGEPVEIVIKGLDLAQDQQVKVLKRIRTAYKDKPWQVTPSVVNPFDAKIESLKRTIDMFKLQPLRQVPLQKNMKLIKKKQQLFNDYFSVVKENFPDNAVGQDTLIRITEGLVSYLAMTETGFDRQQFQEYLLENELNFIGQHQIELSNLEQSLKERNRNYLLR